AGDGGNGPGNRKGIGVEICRSLSGGDKFLKAEENAAELTAKILLDFSWGIDHVKKHQDFSGKYCPHRTLDLGWDRFLAKVEKKRRILAGLEVEEADRLTLNGFTIERAKDFSILWWDAGKKNCAENTYINGGFFAWYPDFTLPVGNIVCDVKPGTVASSALTYLTPYISLTDKKLRYGTQNNLSPQFKGRNVTTLVLPHTGKPFMAELSEPPSGARYAISGIPVIRDGADVSYRNFVLPQGWDASPFYATSRNFVGIKGDTLWIVSGASKTENFVEKSEVYDKLKAFGFTDLMALDGGGSYYHKYAGKPSSVWTANRDVNNLILF
ncbi:MAG: N-acetylmuramoyl-L-alanine amidase, partial [Clostridia bacterium]|nr:N-acetylmuramoyl-L-alanine amidase [Clostridia bacterium]